MTWFNTKDLHNTIAVYLLYVNEELAYIGRSSNLKTRINQHLNLNIELENQEWKKQINKIEYYICNSTADSDIVETYLINTLHPIFNKDKVYLGGVSIKIELPEKRTLPVFEKDFKKEVGNFSFKSIMQEYCNLVDNVDSEENNNRKEYLEQISQQHLAVDIKDIVDQIGTKRIRTLNYIKAEINKELYNVCSEVKDAVKEALEQKIVLGNFYTSVEIKDILKDIYKQVKISKSPKGTDINNYFKTKVVSRRIGNDVLKGFIIEM